MSYHQLLPIINLVFDVRMLILMQLCIYFFAQKEAEAKSNFLFLKKVLKIILL